MASSRPDRGGAPWERAIVIEMAAEQSERIMMLLDVSVLRARAMAPSSASHDRAARSIHLIMMIRALEARL